MTASATGKSENGYRLNHWSAGVVAAVILCTPLALGGNRPAVWALSAVILFSWGSLYFAWHGLHHRPVRADVSQYPLVTALFWTMAAYIALQLLPVAALLPDAWRTLPNDIDPGNRISLAPADTALALMRWLGYGMLFYLCLQIAASGNRSTVFLKLLFWIVVAHALYGLALLFEFDDAILFTEKWAYQGSATGGFVNRNSFATFLAMGLVTGTALLGNLAFGTRGDDRRRWLGLLDGRGEALYLFAGSLAIGATLMLTASRMGMVAALAGCLVVFLLTAHRSRRVGNGRAILALLALLAAVSIVAMLYGGAVVERLGSLDVSAGIRTDLYRQVWSMILERPLTGFGGNSFEHAYPLYHHAPVSFDLFWDKTHSTYLALWVDYGLVFGSLPLLVVACCFAKLVRLLGRARETEPGTIAAIGAITVAAVHSTVDFSLEIQGVTYLFIAVLATGLGPIARHPRGSGAMSW